MSCTDCFNNCADRYTTDRCVEYTGVDVPALGICKGDSLYQIEVIIIEKLQSALNGPGIDVSSIDLTCSFLTDILGSDNQTLLSLLQTLVTGECALRQLIQDIQDSLSPQITVNAPCLSLPSTPTRDQVLVAAAEKVCAVNTAVSAIQVDYVKASQLCAAVTACLSSSGITQEYTKMPKYVPMPYLGPLSVFDSSGKGLSAFGYDKVYICNGNNNTQDMRGRVAVGANINVVGPSLDAAVDPSLSQNAGYAFAQNTKKGGYTDTLSISQIPSHTHGVNDPGHSHSTGFGADCASGNAHCNYAKLDGGTNTKPSTSNTTEITIQATGGGQPHNTTQPSFGVVWIIFVP